MGSYKDTAWSYDEESLGLDLTEQNLKFVPNEKELKLFKEEKSNMYKGTWMICLVYGISAIALLAVVFLTDWGKEYVYDKFLPAVLTYVIGAIIIIIYLVLSIFSLQPRKIGRGMNVLPICPDYWKLQPMSDERKNSIIQNTTKYDHDGTCPTPSSDADTCSIQTNPNNKYAIKDYTGKNDVVYENAPSLNYKCVPDPMIFGTLTDYNNMNDNLKNENDKLLLASDYNTSQSKTSKLAPLLGGSDINDNNLDTDKIRLEYDARFLYKESIKNKEKPDKRQYINGYDASDKLLDYAKLTGSYKEDWNRNGTTSANTPFSGSLFVDQKKKYNNYPLICNEVYPGILDKLEEKGKDNLKCELAKTCGISWSKLDCYPNNVE